MLTIGLLLPSAALSDPSAARLKELVSLEGVRENQLIGYGIVVGLKGTGDRQQTLFTAQSLANMLRQMGVTGIPPRSWLRTPPPPWSLRHCRPLRNRACR